MKLAELLNVDTTKENWFKLLSKKGINPKTVSAVSKGGGEGAEVKEWYYRINIDKAIQEGLDDVSIGMLFGLCTDYVTKINISTDSGSLYKYTQIPASTLDNLKVSIAGKINDGHPSYMDMHKANRLYPIYVYGDYITRVYHMFASFQDGLDIAEIKQMLNPYMTEISKEEYESLIEWPITILGKE